MFYTREELVLHSGGVEMGSTKLTDTPSKWTFKIFHTPACATQTLPKWEFQEISRNSKSNDGLHVFISTSAFHTHDPSNLYIFYKVRMNRLMYAYVMNRNTYVEKYLAFTKMSLMIWIAYIFTTNSILMLNLRIETRGVSDACLLLFCNGKNNHFVYISIL